MKFFVYLILVFQIFASFSPLFEQLMEEQDKIELLGEDKTESEDEKEKEKKLLTEIGQQRTGDLPRPAEMGEITPRLNRMYFDIVSPPPEK